MSSNEINKIFSGGSFDPDIIVNCMKKREKPLPSIHQLMFENTNLIDAFCYKVWDGDTCKIIYETPGGSLVHSSVRLYGIDTPERNPKKGTKDEKVLEKQRAKLARDYLKEIIYKRKIKIRIHKKKTDKYGRLLGILYPREYEDENPGDGLFKKSVNEMMMLEKHAKLAYADISDFKN